MPNLHIGAQLIDACPSYREALDAYVATMSTDDPAAERAAWEKVQRAAAEYKGDGE